MPVNKSILKGHVPLYIIPSLSAQRVFKVAGYESRLIFILNFKVQLQNASNVAIYKYFTKHIKIHTCTSVQNSTLKKMPKHLHLTTKTIIFIHALQMLLNVNSPSVFV